MTRVEFGEYSPEACAHTLFAEYAAPKLPAPIALKALPALAGSTKRRGIGSPPTSFDGAAPHRTSSAKKLSHQAECFPRHVDVHVESLDEQIRFRVRASAVPGMRPAKDGETAAKPGPHKNRLEPIRRGRPSVGSCLRHGRRAWRRDTKRWGSAFLALSFMACSILLSGCSCPMLSARPKPPLELSATNHDPNGFLLNPVFLPKPSTGTLDPRYCADRKACGASGVNPVPDWTKDVPLLCKDNGFGREGKVGAGHWNYWPATFTGTVSFTDHSFDDDYDFDMVPDSPGEGVLTRGNEGLLHLEFKASETIDHFTTKWWRDFAELVRNDQDPQSFLRQRRAVVTGLVGLDCVHCYQTELHPVFSFAVNVTSDDEEAENLEHWVLFVRRVGTEGECATKATLLEHEDHSRVTRLVLKLPWREGMKSAFPFEGSNLRGTKGASYEDESPTVWVTGKAGDGVSVDIPLGTMPTERYADWARVSGELILKWSRCPLDAMEAPPIEGKRDPEPEKRAVTQKPWKYLDIHRKRADSGEKLKKALEKLRKGDLTKFEQIDANLGETYARRLGFDDDTEPLKIAVSRTPPLEMRALGELHVTKPTAPLATSVEDPFLSPPQAEPKQ